MTQPEPSDVRGAYDAVARAYDARFAHELDGKPLERALLAAFVELAGSGVIADVGCGPGHITRFLADHGADVLGIDLAPAMIDIARQHAPALPFIVGSMLELPVADAAWAGAVALYSIIHSGFRPRPCLPRAGPGHPPEWLVTRLLSRRERRVRRW